MLSKWTWCCPIENCHGCGKKPLFKTRARRHGVEHMQKIHHSDIEPIVVKWDQL